MATTFEKDGVKYWNFSEPQDKSFLELVEEQLTSTYHGDNKKAKKTLLWAQSDRMDDLVANNQLTEAEIDDLSVEFAEVN